MENTPHYANRPGKLHCPQCKGEQISAIVETTVNGGVTTSSRNGRMAATTMSNTHRNYWMCQSCGNKFRNIQNLEEEIATEEKKAKWYMVFGIVAAVIALFAIMNLMKNPITIIFFGFFTLVAVISAIVCFAFVPVTKNKIAKMRSELDYLKTNCFG